MYIDETGDHRYRQLDQLERRYLGLTGVLINKEYYDKSVPQTLEALKRQFFKYDPDRPPILVRSHIVYRKYGATAKTSGRDCWSECPNMRASNLKVQLS